MALRAILLWRVVSRTQYDTCDGLINRYRHRQVTWRLTRIWVQYLTHSKTTDDSTAELQSAADVEARGWFGIRIGLFSSALLLRDVDKGEDYRRWWLAHRPGARRRHHALRFASLLRLAPANTDRFAVPRREPAIHRTLGGQQRALPETFPIHGLSTQYYSESLDNDRGEPPITIARHGRYQVTASNSHRALLAVTMYRDITRKWQALSVRAWPA